MIIPTSNTVRSTYLSQVIRNLRRFTMPEHAQEYLGLQTYGLNFASIWLFVAARAVFQRHRKEEAAITLNSCARGQALLRRESTG